MRGLVTLASILLAIGILATWVDRVALQDDTYTHTSAEMLQQPEIRQALSVYMVDQLYANVDVQAELAQRLPPSVAGLAGPIAGALHDYAQRAAAQLMATPRAQQLWADANARAHKRLLQVITGSGTTRFSTANGDVAVNLGPMITRLSERLGLQPPPSLAGGQIVIIRSNQLSTVQTIVKALKQVSVYLIFVVLALYAIAIYLAKGRRREAVRACGIGIVAAGVTLIVARGLIGRYLVDSLTTLPDNRDAASAAWSVLTTELADIITTVTAVGVITILWAWLSGRGRRPAAIRWALSRYTRLNPVRVWLVFAGIVLLLIAWAPTGGARRPQTILILTVLAAIGTEALRRQSVTEYPDAVGAAGGGMGAVRARISTGAPPSQPDKVDQLERLARLHERGSLTDQEFEAQKHDLLGNPTES